MAPSVVKNANGDMPKECARCGAPDAHYTARQDNVCQDCFARFIETKIIKRLERTDFRARNSTKGMIRKLLLPLSGGISSAALLRVVSRYLDGQMARMGRTGFELVVLFVDEGSYGEGEVEGFMEEARERYPRHEYRRVPMMAQGGLEDEEAKEEEQQAEEDDDEPDPLDMNDILNSLTSPTSHSDISAIALTHTIIRQAQLHNCEGVLWGDTTTRLAEKILASTALGRGATLPWLVNDGPSPYTLPHSSAQITFLYPMKDVFRKELDPYGQISGLKTLNTPQRANGAVVSSKNATIDGLMKEYFESVEKDYPSVVANVVRTSSKLQPPLIGMSQLSMQEEEDGAPILARSCRLCGVPVAAGEFGIHNWGGSQIRPDGSGPEAREAATESLKVLRAPSVPVDPMILAERQLCYGCARSTLIA